MPKVTDISTDPRFRKTRESERPSGQQVRVLKPIGIVIDSHDSNRCFVDLESNFTCPGLRHTEDGALYCSEFPRSKNPEIHNRSTPQGGGHNYLKAENGKWPARYGEKPLRCKPCIEAEHAEKIVQDHIPPQDPDSVA